MNDIDLIVTFLCTTLCKSAIVSFLWEDVIKLWTLHCSWLVFEPDLWIFSPTLTTVTGDVWNRYTWSIYWQLCHSLTAYLLRFFCQNISEFKHWPISHVFWTSLSPVAKLWIRMTATVYDNGLQALESNSQTLHIYDYTGVQKRSLFHQL